MLCAFVYTETCSKRKIFPSDSVICRLLCIIIVESTKLRCLALFRSRQTRRYGTPREALFSAVSTLFKCRVNKSNLCKQGRKKSSILICEYGWLAAFWWEEKFAGWSFNKAEKKSPRGFLPLHIFFSNKIKFRCESNKKKKKKCAVIFCAELYFLQKLMNKQTHL
jgi:hypothetical protein